MSTLDQLTALATIAGIELDHPESVTAMAGKTQAAREWARPAPLEPLDRKLAAADPTDWPKIAKAHRIVAAEHQSRKDTGTLVTLVAREADRVVTEALPHYYEQFAGVLTAAAEAIGSDVPLDPQAAIAAGRGEELGALQKGLHLLDSWARIVASGVRKPNDTVDAVAPRWAAIVDAPDGVPLERYVPGTVPRQRVNSDSESARISAAHSLVRAAVNDQEFLTRVARGELAGLEVSPATSTDQVLQRIRENFKLELIAISKTA